MIQEILFYCIPTFSSVSSQKVSGVNVGSGMNVYSRSNSTLNEDLDMFNSYMLEMTAATPSQSINHITSA